MILRVNPSIVDALDLDGIVRKHGVGGRGH
jgi:hypothetical protein